MTKDKTRKKSPMKRVFLIIGIIFIVLSGIPCLITLINIPPVIQYAIQKDGNAALQIYIPLVLAGFINGLGLISLVVSFVIKERSHSTQVDGAIQ
jgi:hypothetical protein